jgi:hypothetical protein
LSWLNPFFLPIYITGFVCLIGWGTLYSQDSTPHKRRRARFAYLYFDGSYGIYSNLVLALVVSFLFTSFGQWVVMTFLKSLFLFFGFQAVMYTLVFWQLYITGYKIPRSIFLINGYSGRMGRYGGPNAPPGGKLSFAILGGGLVLRYGVAFLITVANLGLAWVLYQIYRLFV